MIDIIQGLIASRKRAVISRQWATWVLTVTERRKIFLLAAMCDC